jgi:hypothetical protein
MNKDEIKASVEGSGNVLSLSMEELRNAWGYRRLGPYVRSEISKDLRGMGVGHYPEELGDYQNESVRLYRLGTPLATIIEAVLHPSADTDEQLRELAAREGDARATLDRIRALVCD